MSACVYIAKDANGTVLYVGKSINIKNRFTSHRDESPWFKSCSTIDVLHFDTEEDALSAEISIIKKMMPKDNVSYNKRGRAVCSSVRRKPARPRA